MQIYNDFRVTEYDRSTGHISVAWYDNTRLPSGKLAIPIKQQHPLHRSHKVPLESEVADWGHAQMLAYLLNEVEDVYDIPAWAVDEANKTKVRPDGEVVILG